MHQSDHGGGDLVARNIAMQQSRARLKMLLRSPQVAKQEIVLKVRLSKAVPRASLHKPQHSTKNFLPCTSTCYVGKCGLQPFVICALRKDLLQSRYVQQFPRDAPSQDSSSTLQCPPLTT